MSEDFGLSRQLPAFPYTPTGKLLLLPFDALQATISLLKSAEGLEACVFWYGHRGVDSDIVTAVRAPRQKGTRFNYHVDEASMSMMSSTLSEEVRPLAQVHSHPGPMVEHSRYDDEMISSRRALSIVFPRYGHVTGPWPAGIGIHEWQAGYWYLLETSYAAERVKVIRASGVSVEDLR